MTPGALLLTVTCPWCWRRVLRIYDHADRYLLLESRKPIIGDEPNPPDWPATKPAKSRECVTESKWLNSERILLACFHCEPERRRAWNGKATPLHLEPGDVSSKLSDARRDGHPRELVASELERGESVTLDEALRRIRE